MTCFTSVVREDRLSSMYNYLQSDVRSILISKESVLMRGGPTHLRDIFVLACVREPDVCHQGEVIEIWPPRCRVETARMVCCEFLCIRVKTRRFIPIVHGLLNISSKTLERGFDFFEKMMPEQSTVVCMESVKRQCLMHIAWRKTPESVLQGQIQGTMHKLQR